MILVTGATGFIGQHLVKQLVEAQYPVCSLIRPSPRERSFAPGVRTHIVAGDLTTFSSRKSNSFSIRNPATAGRNLATSVVEACARWAVPKASLTYTSP